MSELNLKVLSGSASADEIAAIMAVLTAIAAAKPSKPAPVNSNWADPALLHRRPLPSSWATSFLVR
jgi:hypothetical protein